MSAEPEAAPATGVTGISPSSEGASQLIPPVVPAKSRSRWLSWFERDERNQLEKDGEQSHRIRRIAAYGGLGVACLLYLAGLVAIALVLGLLSRFGFERVTADMWHIVVAVLVALFTVPTVLVIAILKVTSPNQTSEVPASIHEALGKMVEKAFDKITD